MMQDRFRFRWWDYNDKEYTYDVQNLCEMDCFGSVCGTDCYGNPGIETADNFGELLILQAKGCGVIEQCTGLRNRNGKLIYEGDIVKIRLSFDEIVYVSYNDDRFELEGEYGLCVPVRLYKNDCEVIGNIHENPELLEEK